MKQILFSFTLLLLFLLHCPTTLAKSPAPVKSPAPAPAPSPTKAPPPAKALSPATGPIDITKILEKSGKFSKLIRLLKSSKVGIQINNQLNNLNEGVTVFAPTDSAFLTLKAGILNSLSDKQQVQLVLFHVLPTLLPTSQFQTVSNPIRTLAGDTSKDQFPLYVTTSGDQVNVSTGIVSATVADTIYSDNQLAIYQVDKVLLPMNIFGSTPALELEPADKLAPAPSESGKKSPATTSVKSSSSDTRRGIMVSIFIFLFLFLFHFIVTN